LKKREISIFIPHKLSLKTDLNPVARKYSIVAEIIDILLILPAMRLKPLSRVMCTGELNTPYYSDSNILSEARALRAGGQLG